MNLDKSFVFKGFKCFFIFLICILIKLMKKSKPNNLPGCLINRKQKGGQYDETCTSSKDSAKRK